MKEQRLNPRLVQDLDAEAGLQGPLATRDLRGCASEACPPEGNSGKPLPRLQGI